MKMTDTKNYAVQSAIPLPVPSPEEISFFDGMNKADLIPLCHLKKRMLKGYDKYMYSKGYGF